MSQGHVLGDLQVDKDICNGALVVRRALAEFGDHARPRLWVLRALALPVPESAADAAGVRLEQLVVLLLGHPFCP